MVRTQFARLVLEQPMSEEFEANFYHRVKEPYEAYLAIKNKPESGRRRDIRAATEAATALYHLREQLPPEHQHSWSRYAQMCSDYGLLRDVVDTTKHGRLVDQTRAICNPGQIEEFIVVTEYEDESGPYKHADKSVRLNLTDGSIRDLLDVLTAVMNFWQDELHALGLINRMKNYQLPARVQPLRREDCNGGEMGLAAVQGFAFKQSFALQRHNRSTGRLEPIDLTGANLEIGIFKSQYCLDVTATQNGTGKKVTRTVSLSEVEWHHIQSLHTAHEQSAYLLTLPQARAAQDEIAAEINSTQIK
jgi:hypothetical protein